MRRPRTYPARMIQAIVRQTRERLEAERGEPLAPEPVVFAPLLGAHVFVPAGGGWRLSLEQARHAGAA